MTNTNSKAPEPVKREYVDLGMGVPVEIIKPAPVPQEGICPKECSCCCHADYREKGDHIRHSGEDRHHAAGCTRRYWTKPAPEPQAEEPIDCKHKWFQTKEPCYWNCQKCGALRPYDPNKRKERAEEYAEENAHHAHGPLGHLSRANLALRAENALLRAEVERWKMGLADMVESRDKAKAERDALAAKLADIKAQAEDMFEYSLALEVRVLRAKLAEVEKERDAWIQCVAAIHTPKECGWCGLSGDHAVGCPVFECRAILARRRKEADRD